MFNSVSMDDQVGVMCGDRLRVLVVGAGVAGLALVQLLKRGGLHPVLAERAADHADSGYMLALMPMVDRVLGEMGVRDAYLARSVPFRRYVLHGRHGRTLRDYDIGSLVGAWGDYQGIARGELMQVLAQGGIDVAYQTTLSSLRQTADAVDVEWQQDGVTGSGEFDAVLLADGLHSGSRRLLLDDGELNGCDTHWGGWVAWMPVAVGHDDRGDEVWGKDFFLGAYPVQGMLGVILAGHEDDTRAGPDAFADRVRRQLRVADAWMGAALEAVTAMHDPYYWKLADCRSARWTVGRVALVGDAASGFLPTAGIGAGMAMESAGVLARRLLVADRETVAAALRDYEATQRPRVETAQGNSRQLANMMFRRSAWWAMMRDVLARFITLKMALKPIRRLLDAPADG